MKTLLDMLKQTPKTKEEAIAHLQKIGVLDGNGELIQSHCKRSVRTNRTKAPKKKPSQGSTALNNLKKLCKRIPADFDAKKELAAARDEKYAKG